jgi:hypothetical protein
MLNHATSFLIVLFVVIFELFLKGLDLDKV